MLSIVHDYLAQCTQRNIEPYYGFIEHAKAGEIVADLDFAPLQSVRVFAAALLRCGQASNAARGMKLRVMILRYGVNRGSHHPPRQSKRLVPYEVLIAQRSPDDVIVAPQSRLVLRGLVDGVRAACMAHTRHLVRVELCGLPLNQLPEATARLFDVLPRCDALRVLNLNQSTLKDKLFTRLTTSMSSFAALKEAHFSECGLTDSSARGIHSLILLNRGREQGGSWRASLRDGGSCSARAPATLRALEALDFSGNSLGDATLMRLALAIAHDASLQVIDLSRNLVTTPGLLEFLRQGALQSSAIQLIDLSKNLIDGRLDYIAGDNFTCLHTHGQQFIISRIDGQRTSDTGAMLPLPPRPEASTRPISRSKPLRTVVTTVDTVGAPLEVVHHSGASAEDTGDCRNSILAQNTLGAESDEGVVSQATQSANELLPARVQSCSISHDTVGLCSSTSPSREEQKLLERSFFSPPRGSPSPQRMKKQQKHNHDNLEQNKNVDNRQQQATMPFFTLPLFSTGSGELLQQQQWCGVPLYVPVPLSSLGCATAAAHPARPTRNIGVGTSSSLDVLNMNGANSGSPTSCGDDGRDHLVQDSRVDIDDNMTLETMMDEHQSHGMLGASEWVGREQRFLQSLVGRLESHENATVEMLERNHQVTCDRLSDMREELLRRIREVLIKQQEESERLRDEVRNEILAQEKRREETGKDSEDVMAEQLAELIKTGLKYIHDNLDRQATGDKGATSPFVAPAVREVPPVSDYLCKVKERLSDMGW